MTTMMGLDGAQGSVLPLGTNIGASNVGSVMAPMAVNTELFGRLSPIIDSEDDCQQEDDSHLQKITLKYEVVDEFDIPPWIDSTDFPFNNPFRQKQPTNELGIQCRPAHGPMIDKHLQTTYIDYEDNSLQIEYKIEYPDCIYEESAENRILQCLSTMLYSNELVSWLSPYEKTENRVQKGISISPNCKDATKVVDSHASPETVSRSIRENMSKKITNKIQSKRELRKNSVDAH